MTTTAQRPTEAPAPISPAPTPFSPPPGPSARVVLGSLAVGAATAAALTLVAFPGAPEHVTTGLALLSFALGWGLLAVLTKTQRWAYVPAAFLAVSGLALVTLAPGDDGLSAAAWVWPPALLAVIAWSGRHARPDRTRWLVYPVLAVLGLASVGALVEDVAARHGSMQMPGALYDVGGRRLHLSCTGTGTPTVVLESGLGGSSPLWQRVVDGTASTTRVCAYDRAGQGWSDDAPAPQDSAAVTADLHRLLAAAGEPAPYVLVGHSVGGVYAMTYAAHYPLQVAGLVLLDSASPRQFTVLPAYAGQYAMITRLYGVLPTLARLGVGRAVPALTGNDVPGAAGRQARAFASTPRSARNARDELSTYRRSFAQAQALTTLGRRPLVVVSTTESLRDTAGWTTAQRQLTSLSGNADQRTVASTHVGVLDDPHASTSSVTAIAIADVVRAVRTGGPVPTRTPGSPS